jgi:hypothetical protein
MSTEDDLPDNDGLEWAAQPAARACRLPIPTKKQQYTLAELFNQGTQQYPTRGIGFITA